MLNPALKTVAPKKPFAPPGGEAARPSASRLAASGRKLVLVTDMGGLAAVGGAWRALEAESLVPPTVFQSYDWVKAWADTYLPRHPDLSLCIVLGYEAGKLVFVFPLQAEGRHGLRQLSALTQCVGQYSDILCHKTADPGFWMAAAMAEIHGRAMADLLRLRQVRHSAALHAYAQRNFFSARQNESAPALQLTLFKSPEAYDGRYSHAQRHRRKRIRKKIEKQGPITFETLPAGPAQAQAIAEALGEKLKWLHGHGRYNVVLGDEAFVALSQALALRQDQGFQQIVTRMQAGGNPVAWELGYRYQNRHYHFLTAHQDGKTDLSPGRLMLDYSMKEAIKAGIAEFDLLPPLHRHKASFSSKLEPVSDWYLPLTPKGALYGHLAVGLLRPILRKVYHALPEAMTKPILRLLGIRRDVS